MPTPLMIFCGSSEINRTGEYLLKVILSNMLEIHNVGNTPTIVTSNRQAVLYITLGNMMNGLVKNWRVLDELYMSQHSIFRSEIERIRQKNKESHLNYNMVLLQMSGEIRSEMELEKE